MVSAKRIRIISSSPSLSAEIIAHNNDLLTKMLLCLPIKSLLKFKCISKNWLSLISNPDFCLRLSLSCSPCALFVDKWSHFPEFDFINLESSHSNAPFRTLTFVNDPSGIKILQSCNGLLLCCSYRIRQCKASYYVYNPTTKQYTVLPPISQVGEIAGPYLAFDPSKSPHYKVICLRQCNIAEPDFQIEIYSSETGPWRVSAARLTLGIDIGLHGGVHWYTDSGPSFCFDVDREQVREMPMPPIPDDWYRRRVIYFQESGGHLLLIEIYRHAAKQFKVCEMAKDYSGWSVKYCVDLDGVISAFPEMVKTHLEPSALNYYAYEIMCIVIAESDDDSYLVLHIPSKFIRYDFKDKSFKNICDFAPSNAASEDAENFGYYNSYVYIESLACV